MAKIRFGFKIPPPRVCVRETYREEGAVGCIGCYVWQIWSFEYSDGTVETLRRWRRET